MPRRSAPKKPKPGPPSEAAFVAPYPPSWLDRVIDRVGRLPGPSWLAYVAAVVVIEIILEAAHWLTAASPLGTFSRLHLVFAGSVPISLALTDYLDRTALRAFEDFLPAMRATPKEQLALRYRLVTIPRLSAIWAGIAFALAGVAFGTFAPLLIGAPPVLQAVDPGAGMSLLFGIAPSPLTVGLMLSLVIAMFMTLGAAIYHTLNQLVIISRIYARHTNVNLFNLAPLYAFSRQTARTTIVLLVAALAGYLLAPELYHQTGVVLVVGLLLLVLLAVFVLPLTGAHGLLAREKQRLIAQNGALLEVTVAELHRRVTSGRLKDMDNMNMTLASLEIERAALLRVPTWPWEPGTVRGVVAAVLLPVFLYAVQQILSRTLGG